MKKLTITLLLLTGYSITYGQADTAGFVKYTGFEENTGYLQFSMGYNIPVGRYGNGSQPFRNAYANSLYPNLNISASFGQKINARLNYLMGIQFIRTKFDYEAFGKAYLTKYGDTMTLGNFNYEHISVQGGIGYNYSKNKININVFTGAGVLYTVLFQNTLTPSMGPNSKNYLNRGTIEMGKSLRPMIFAGADVKYYIGYDTYLFAGAFYTFSSFRQVITEESVVYPYNPIGEFLKKDLLISNLAVNLGIGTVFR